MPLADGQVQIRDLVMGCGTVYEVTGFNPWSRSARTSAAGERPWNHGGWSGAEWLDETIVPMRVYVRPPEKTPQVWLPLHQALMAAFEPVGDAGQDVELRFAVAGSEFVMFGRPRQVEPDTGELRVHRGRSWSSAAFVALDPRIYSGVEQSAQLGLPTFTGGLTAPIVAPFTVDGVMVGGRVTVANDGLADTPLSLRIDGPAVTPSVTLQRPDGLIQTLTVLFDLAAGQWLDIDTGSHAVLLNGVANRRGNVAGEFPILPPGTSTLRFNAADFDAAAELTARWRHAW